MGTSLRVLRQLTGIKTGDCLILEATHASANTTSFRDVARLADRGDQAASIVNKILYFSDGTATNLQHEARVTSFATSSKTITFDPAATDIPQAGDTAELWSVSDRIGTTSHITLLINHAIDAVKNMAGPEVYDTVQTYDARTGSLTIPSTWAEFGGAEYLAPNSGSFRNEVRESFLTVQPGLRTVRIRGRGASQAHRRSVYLFGYERCLPLVDETDETPVDAEWIVESVAEALTLGRSWASGDPAAAERRANFWSAKAQMYRRNANSARRGLGIALL